MERILVLIDASGTKRATMEFSCYLANLTRSRLTGLLFRAKEIGDEGYTNFQQPGTAAETKQQTRPDSTNQGIDEYKVAFKSYCDNHQVMPAPEFIEVNSMEDVCINSRYADLMIIGSDASFTNEPENVPSALALDILKNAECPVFIAPLACRPISEIIFAFDGSESSVYAIKQFAHLFPQFDELPVTLLEVSDEAPTPSENLHLSAKRYLQSHYKTIKYQVLIGRAENELFSYFLEKKNVIVVMGSFGRTIISSLFHRSPAPLLLKTTGLPVFISHK